MDEARSRGLYNEKKIQTETLQYSKKHYYDNFIAWDNKTHEVNKDDEIKKYVLYRENEPNKAERVQFHLEKLLTKDEKSAYNYIPPKKQELPLAFIG